MIGETPNLAARLQALAGNDEVVIPENTRRLVGNLFDYQSLDEVEVKGLAAPIVAFRVLRETPSMRLAGRHFPEERLEMPLPHQAQTVLTIINRAGGYERALGRFERVAHVRLDRAVLEAERQATVAVL